MSESILKLKSKSCRVYSQSSLLGMFLNIGFAANKACQLSVELFSLGDVNIFELLRYCEYWSLFYIPLFVDTGNVSKMFACGVRPMCDIVIHTNAW